MKILFQGDSITDCGRTRSASPENHIGGGYPSLIKSILLYEDPENYKLLNRGISGNRIVDVYARMKRDIINLQPDVMSILIGVNDVWHEFHESPNGVDNEKFYKIYDMLISEIKAALPNMKIIIMEPFALCGSGNEEYWTEFSKEVKLRAESAKKIAEKYNLSFIELQNGFDNLAKRAPASCWLEDGVHPTMAGHEFIKNEWLKAFRGL